MELKMKFVTATGNIETTTTLRRTRDLPQLRDPERVGIFRHYREWSEEEYFLRTRGMLPVSLPCSEAYSSITVVGPRGALSRALRLFMTFDRHDQYMCTWFVEDYGSSELVLEPWYEAATRRVGLCLDSAMVDVFEPRTLVMASDVLLHDRREMFGHEGESAPPTHPYIHIHRHDDRETLSFTASRVGEGSYHESIALLFVITDYLLLPTRIQSNIRRIIGDAMKENSSFRNRWIGAFLQRQHAIRGRLIQQMGEGLGEVASLLERSKVDGRSPLVAEAREKLEKLSALAGSAYITPDIIEQMSRFHLTNDETDARSDETAAPDPDQAETTDEQV